MRPEVDHPIFLQFSSPGEIEYSWLTQESEIRGVIDHIYIAWPLLVSYEGSIDPYVDSAGIHKLIHDVPKAFHDFSPAHIPCKGDLNLFEGGVVDAWWQIAGPRSPFKHRPTAAQL